MPIFITFYPYKIMTNINPKFIKYSIGTFKKNMSKIKRDKINIENYKFGKHSN